MTRRISIKLQLFKMLTLNGNVRWIFLLSRALLVQLSAVCADMTIMTASWSVLRRISMIRRVYPFWSSNAHPALIITLSWSKRYALFLLIRIPSSWRPYMLFIMESTGITRLPPQMIWGSPDHAFLHGSCACLPDLSVADEQAGLHVCFIWRRKEGSTPYPGSQKNVTHQPWLMMFSDKSEQKAHK